MGVLKTHPTTARAPSAVDALRAKLLCTDPSPARLGELLDAASASAGSLKTLRDLLDSELWQKLLCLLPVDIRYIVSSYFERDDDLLTPRELLEGAAEAHDVGCMAVASAYIQEARTMVTWERIRELLLRDHGQQYLDLVPSAT